MLGTCKTCRWWGMYKDAWKGESKACGSPILVDIDGHKDGYLAVSGDGFGLDYPVCDLMTGPDFGCVHHEEKK
jgi:hypothetical protein